MSKKIPRSSPDNALRLYPPTVGDVIDVSPAIEADGHLQTAWNLVSEIGYRGGDLTALAVAIACLCRELEKRSGPSPPEPAPGDVN